MKMLMPVCQAICTKHAELHSGDDVNNDRHVDLWNKHAVQAQVSAKSGSVNITKTPFNEKWGA